MFSVSFHHIISISNCCLCLITSCLSNLFAEGRPLSLIFHAGSTYLHCKTWFSFCKISGDQVHEPICAHCHTWVQHSLTHTRTNTLNFTISNLWAHDEALYLFLSIYTWMIAFISADLSFIVSYLFCESSPSLFVLPLIFRYRCLSLCLCFSSLSLSLYHPLSPCVIAVPV